MAHDKIDAFPRKKLFIDILTQDVSVSACILDLIDNSTDSYVRGKISDHREINLIIREDKFEIFDNCGGISKDYLKEHVFKFGSVNRDIENPTLGMYGIGLKRSIFKLGNDITLETDDGSNYSYMSLNVDEWERDEKTWDIPFDYDSSKIALDDKPYTKITVSNLHKEIKTKFGLESFRNEMQDTIKKCYCLIIKDHIDFHINTEQIIPAELVVPVNEEYHPNVHKEIYEGMEVEIVCFVEPSKGQKNNNAVNERGWNVFCNKRLILANDTTEDTGWVGQGDKSMLPQYHNSFNEFRGIVLLNSNNPFDLPLNTSKSGLNKDHRNYHYILNAMVKTARPVVDYLRTKFSKELDGEKEIEDKISEIQDNGPSIKYTSISNLNFTKFTAPSREIMEKRITTARISYARQKETVVKVMKYMGVSTYKEVGEQTFDYYLEMEGLSNE